MRNCIRFLPLLILYIVVILVASNDTFWGDEGGYVSLAQNFARGYYSSKTEVNLWWGPGYPIILLPFVLLQLPWIVLRLVNAFFLFFGIFYFYSALRLYIQARYASCFSYLLGIYIPFLRYIHYLITETFVIFLVCGFLYHFCKFYQNSKFSWHQLLIASFYLGYLTLTKVLFGYVILVGLLLFLVLYLWTKKDYLKKTIFVYCLALFFCLPYLFYTYSLTGRIFYWGSSGGMSLYWMSTPHENEYGDWHSVEDVRQIPELFKNHNEFFHSLADLSQIQKDDAFRDRAVCHIRHNPGKYFQNWVANLGRLLFNCPYSYTPQKLSTYFYIIPNAFVFVLSVICIYPSFKRRKQFPYEIPALMLFALIAFLESSLISAYARQFYPLVPIVALWIIFTLVLLQGKARKLESKATLVNRR